MPGSKIQYKILILKQNIDSFFTMFPTKRECNIIVITFENTGKSFLTQPIYLKWNKNNQRNPGEFHFPKKYHFSNRKIIQRIYTVRINLLTDEKI